MLAPTGCTWAAPFPTATNDCSHSAEPKYLPDGSPTQCDASAAANAVAESVRACAEQEGIVRVTFDFEREGAPRHVHADLECDECRLPRAAEQRPFLACVERAASAARLPLAATKTTFRVAFPYRVGFPEDPRLKLGWSPMDRGTH
jgi:hypothetical protein